MIEKIYKCNLCRDRYAPMDLIGLHSDLIGLHSDLIGLHSDGGLKTVGAANSLADIHICAPCLQFIRTLPVPEENKC